MCAAQGCQHFGISELHTEDKRDTAVCYRGVYFNGLVRYHLHLLFAGTFDSFNRHNFVAAILALYLKRRHGTLPVKRLHTVAVRRTRDNAWHRYISGLRSALCNLGSGSLDE
jgi:hypothetical protein